MDEKIRDYIVLVSATRTPEMPLDMKHLIGSARRLARRFT
jgi:hypothetical protein